MTGPGESITLITAHRGWFDWRLRQLWRYRDLIGLFVWRDFVSVYKQTILGPAWHIIRPLFTTLIFTLVLATILRESGAIPDALFGGLLLYAGLNTLLPSFLLRTPFDVAPSPLKS